MDTEENICSVSNTSGLPVMVLSSFEENNQAGSTIYETTLTLMSSIEGNKTVADKETAKIQLTGNYFIEDGKKIPGGLYRLLFVHTGSFFPIGVKVTHNLLGPYSPVTVSSEDKERMDMASRFNKYVPVTSALYKDFTNALACVKGINTDAVDNFFKNTDSYKKVDFSSIMTVLSYVRSYPAIWADYQEEYKYHLYSKPSARGDSSFEGTLEFKTNKVSFSNVIDLKKMYAIVFKDVKGKVTPVKYTRGIFSSTEEEDSAIHLVPLFEKKGAITGNTQDKEIIVVLAGKINGVDILGQVEEIKSNSRDPSVNAFLHPHSFQQKMNVAMTVIGVLFGVHFLASLAISGFKLVKGKFQPRSKALTEKDVNDALMRSEEDFKKQAKEIGTEFPERENLLEAIRKVEQEETISNRYRQGRFQIEEITERLNRIVRIAETGSITPKMEEITYNLKKNKEKLERDLQSIESSLAEDKGLRRRATAVQKMEATLSETEKFIQEETELYKEIQKNLESVLEEIADKLKVASENIEKWRTFREKISAAQEELENGKGGEPPGEGDLEKMGSVPLESEKARG